jgi:hypothetical protein
MFSSYTFSPSAQTRMWCIPFSYNSVWLSWIPQCCILKRRYEETAASFYYIWPFWTRNTREKCVGPSHRPTTVTKCFFLNICDISGSHALSITMTVLCDGVQCISAEIDRRFRGAYCFHRLLDDTGSKLFWNVCLFQRDHMTLYPRKLSSSYSPPWEPEISHASSQSYFYSRHIWRIKKLWSEVHLLYLNIHSLENTDSHI